jgi:DNA-directed RNA polymerase sigma subunit (sigma70/sigma32)
MKPGYSSVERVVLASQSWSTAARGIEPLVIREEMRAAVAELRRTPTRRGQAPDTHAREALVLELLYGLDGGGARTFAEVGRIVGCGHERARQLCNGALWELAKLCDLRRSRW